MVINVHAGHNPDGKTACGAVGIIKESAEARNVKNEVIRQLQELGHTVYDCTIEDGTSQSNVLTRIVQKCNAHDADLDVSIHFNAGVNDLSGNGKSTGVEAYVYSNTSKAKTAAENVCACISALGYKNRGVKVNTSLYVLRKTKAPAMLIECCFVDDKDDVQLYDYQSMASAIVHGIAGKEHVDKESGGSDSEAERMEAETIVGDSKAVYRVQVGAYSVKANASTAAQKLKDAGFDAIIVKA